MDIRTIMIDNFKQLRPGHWHQVERTGPGPTYSIEYSNYYNKIPSFEMSRIRYDVVKKYVGQFKTICDFGYGNGDFIEHCYNKGHKAYAYDVSDYPVPPSVQRVYDINEMNFDVVTFFDSLEHIEDEDLVTFLKNLRTKYVTISLPWLHEFLGPEWFSKWKHKKDNEHFHYFDMHGLVGLLSDSNYEILHIGNEEDEIRKPVDKWPNILTIVAKKK
jgi:hypothetical protein